MKKLANILFEDSRWMHFLLGAGLIFVQLYVQARGFGSASSNLSSIAALVVSIAVALAWKWPLFSASLALIAGQLLLVFTWFLGPGTAIGLAILAATVTARWLLLGWVYALACAALGAAAYWFEFQIAEASLPPVGFFLASALLGTAVWAYRRHWVKTVQDQQRLRQCIAGELHDLLGNHLTAIALKANDLEAGKIREEDLDYLRKVARAGLADMRYLSTVLYSEPGQSRRLETHTDLRDVLRYATHMLETHGFNINLSTDGLDRPLQAQHLRFLRRLVMEMIANTLKYGLPGTTVNIGLSIDPKCLDFFYANQGKALVDRPLDLSGRWGVNDLSRICRDNGWSLDISESDARWSLVARIPLELEDVAGAQKGFD